MHFMLSLSLSLSLCVCMFVKVVSVMDICLSGNLPHGCVLIELLYGGLIKLLLHVYRNSSFS